MARYTDASCRQCRRIGEKLFLKGERCYTPRCAVERRKNPPGDRSLKRRRASDWSLQLREKQKARFSYGVLERQFRKYFDLARERPGVTGDILLQYLERRLDNVVYRLGFATSRPQARQMVNHAHFLVNDRRVNIPSYLVKPGDQIRVREKSKKLDVILDSVRLVKGDLDLPWLELDKAKLTGTFIEVPQREDMGIIVNEQLIVELYSK